MRKNFKFKIIAILSIAIMSIFSNNIYAAINQDYVDTTQNEDTLDMINKKLESNELTEAIAHLIYGLASMVEHLVGVVFEALTGLNTFPWADKLIFNAVAFLDVNFINPANNSLFKVEGNEEAVLTGIISNVYYTLFTLALAFLGVAVAIMTIKLILSTIASEKAKYKQALTNFVLAIVMLFSAHFAISFIFYANEQLVEMASNIAIDNMEGVTLPSVKDALGDDIRMENFINSNDAIFNNYGDIRNYYKGNSNRLAIGNMILNDTNLVVDQLGADTGDWNELANPDVLNYVYQITQILEKPRARELIIDLDEAFSNYGDSGEIDSQIENTSADDIVSKLEDFHSQLNSLNLSYSFNDVETGTEFMAIHQKIKESEDMELTQAGDITYRDLAAHILTYPSDSNTEKYFSMMERFASEIGSHTDVEEGQENAIIAGLGEFFKESAWTYGEDSWTNNVLTLQGAILYAIFVFQSLFFFVAYLRRFFYIVILALLAPIIIIFDFFAKSLQ